MPAPRWKEPRAAIDKRQRARDRKAADESARREVRVRDGYACRLCGRKTSSVHEDTRRGAGGVVSLQNSLLLCQPADGGLCHDLVGTRWIYPVMADGSEVFDANGVVVFEMSRASAKRVFEHRTIPSHVRILEEK